jgi:hypothetical protein
MRIKQLHQSFGWLHTKELIKKYSFSGQVNSKNVNEPVLFFGCYGDVNIEKSLNWKNKVLIWWSGGDILHFKKQKELVDKVKKNSNIQHIATSNFIEHDLIELDIPYEKIPLFTLPTDNFKPYKLGDSIYVYKPGSQIYCPMPIYTKIKKEFHSIPFIEAKDHHHAFTQDELHEVYKKSFLSLRFTKHDGLGHTACESGLMGRKIIWNGNTPNAINYSNDDDILIEIENVIKNKYDPIKISKNMHDYLNIGDEWLNV